MTFGNIMRKRFHIYFLKSQKCFSIIICSIILVKFSAKKGPKFWWELWAARIFDILPFWSSSNIMLLFYASYSIRIELKTNRIWKLGEVEDEEDRKLSQFSLSANAKAASPHKCEQYWAFFRQKSLRFGESLEWEENRNTCLI